ncbi:MAG: hypothetical protein GY854_01345 [Deltaproteobacteria bacterium]|nr:hypothetical protein [Deltaproteobacteria bacterium]
MTENHTCQSCGMAIEAGPYCQYCVDESGELFSFKESLSRMSQFMRREAPELSDSASESKALDYMSAMPAWRSHPELLTMKKK